MTEVWYRVEEQRHVSVDEWENTIVHTDIQVIKYPVLRLTPKGAWLDIGIYIDWAPASFGDRKKRFVLREVRKRFACPTLEEAYVSFIARKDKQARIYEARAKSARALIIKAQRLCKGIVFND